MAAIPVRVSVIKLAIVSASSVSDFRELKRPKTAKDRHSNQIASDIKDIVSMIVWMSKEMLFRE